MDSGTRIRFGDAVVDAVSKKELLQRAREILSTEHVRPAVITTVNAQFVYLAHLHPRFAALLEHSDLNVADGMSLVFASRLLQHPLPERIAGVDLTSDLCSLAAEQGFSAYLLGGSTGAAEDAAAHLRKQFPLLRIAGTDCPPVWFEESPALAAQVLRKIQAVHPDVLLVCFGAPKQEYWIEKNIAALPIKLAVGLGCSFDVLSGRAARAPEWMQKAGLEWLFRLCSEPHRLWRRYLMSNSYFLWTVLVQSAAHFSFGRHKLKVTM